MELQIRNSIRFLLNDKVVERTDVSPTETLLDFLRLDRKLRGTKEGCAEGDCGACTVLVGRLFNGQLKYESVNACIRFVGSLDGCHVVTVEALAGSDGTLHPVQQAIVDTHASQCGFCTPGFVMSLYGLVDAKSETEYPGNRKGSAGQSLSLHWLCRNHPGRRKRYRHWRSEQGSTCH